MRSYWELPVNALYIYSFLLSKGYTPQQALAVVKQRYALESWQEKLLKRCIHGKKLSTLVRSRIVQETPPRLCIDAYNQFYTIYAALAGHPVYLCTDGLLRDALGGSIRLSLEELRQIAEYVKPLLEAAERKILVLDSRHPHSLHHARELRRLLPDAIVALSRTADKTLIMHARKGCTVASSDIVVVLNSYQVYDLAHKTITKLKSRVRVIDIASLLEAEHRKWCHQGP